MNTQKPEIKPKNKSSNHGGKRTNSGRKRELNKNKSKTIRIDMELVETVDELKKRVKNGEKIKDLLKPKEKKLTGFEANLRALGLASSNSKLEREYKELSKKYRDLQSKHEKLIAALSHLIGSSEGGNISR